MQVPTKILVFQTAFIGDVVLTLPLVQVLHEYFPEAHIDFVAIPTGASVLAHHPAIHEVITYDKKGKDSGLSGILSLAGALRRRAYDVAVVPHRSLRSAVVVWRSGIPRRIGFATSAGWFLFTDALPYAKQDHEVCRDLSLLTVLGIEPPAHVLPTLYPGREDQEFVDSIIGEYMAHLSSRGRHMIAIAPGSVWNTKRWLKDHFIALIRLLVNEGFGIVLLGSKDDEGLCGEIQRAATGSSVANVAGRLTLLQSAEVIRRCSLLVSNDSAPMHLAVSVRTPVVAIYGPTVPRFGFAPLGPYDQIVEKEGLSCRPCSSHGGQTCPIKTFECMKLIGPQHVYAKVKDVLAATGNAVQHVGNN